MKRLLLIFLISFVSVYGQVVDTNYGTNGKLFVNIPPNENREYNLNTFYTTDQKTVNVGYYDTGSFTNKTYFVTKYNFNGSRDENFGTSGLLDIPAYPNNPGAITITGSVMLDDNSIILSCAANMKAYLVKIAANGTVDPSFGVNGFKLADFLFTANTLTYGDLIKDENNQIFVVYNSYSFASTPIKTYTNLCKISPNGAIDTSFGNNGFSSILINREYTLQTLKQIRIKNGKIYNFATLSYYINSSNSTQTDVWTCHFLDGTPDYGFGDNGYLYMPKDINIKDYNIQEDGKILIAKYIDVSSANSYVKASRYLRSGALDTSFGTTGNVQSGFGQWSVHVPSKIMEIDNNIYIFSHYYKSDSPVEYAATILKYNSNGVSDPAFGTNGLFKISANISGVPNVLINSDKGFIISVWKNTYGELFNIKIDYNMNFLDTDSTIFNSSRVKIYPNPATDILHISGVKNEKFTIYNSVGQIIKKGFYNQNKGIEVLDLNKGSYWLKLGNLKSVQFIKK